MRSCSFTSDERGFEPYGDLIALPLVVGGFVLFMLLFSLSLDSWDRHSQPEISEEDAREIAQALRKSWLPRHEKTAAVLDAVALYEAVNRTGYLREICPQCSGVSVQVNTISENWRFGVETGGEVVCSYLPVAVEFDVARCEPGVIVVCLGGRQ